MGYLHPGTGQTPDLEVVLLNYNGSDLLNRALEVLFRNSPRHPVLVTVVDNHSTDGSQELLRQRFTDRARLLFHEVNGGFARGNNLALGPSRARYALLLNSDTELLDDGELHPLDVLIEYMDSHADVGVLGPRLTDVHDQIEDSTGERIGLTSIVKNRLLRLSRMPRSLTGRISKSLWTYDRERDVDWVSGAALLVRGVILREGCLLDEGYFMYGEDVEWCYRIQKRGWKIRFLPDVTIRHLRHGSAPDRRVTRKQKRLHRQGILRFTELHPSPRHLLLRGLLKLALLF